MNTGASLEIRRFACGPLETNTYVLVDPGGKTCILVDPAEPGGTVEQFLDREGLTVERILLTHGHFDHIAGVPGFRARGNAPVWIHAADADMLIRPEANMSLFIGLDIRMEPADGFLADGAVIPFGSGGGLRVIHTPGHTAGGVCFAGEGFVLAGDTLFRGSVGRTDFPGSSEQALMRSIRDGLLTLEDDVRVYPGHGETTEIGFERKHNPFLSGRFR
ncbi:MBL fold metallo-hydrolase [bacterium]|nr:MBL fold metallo-hydrolase [bacterium]